MYKIIASTQVKVEAIFLSLESSETYLYYK